MSGVLWIGPTLSRSYRDYKHVIRHVRNRSVSQFGPTGTPQRTDSSARRSNTYHSRITNSCNALPHPRHTPIGRPNNQALRSIGAENGARDVVGVNRSPSRPICTTSVGHPPAPRVTKQNLFPLT